MPSFLRPSMEACHQDLWDIFANVNKFFWPFATHAFTNFILGAIDGIMFFITPQWGELLNVKVWYAAVTQSFFSLSVGFGALFTYSSYNDFKHNVYRDALIISFTDTFTSVLAGKWENDLKYFFNFNFKHGWKKRSYNLWTKLGQSAHSWKGTSKQNLFHSISPFLF